MDTPNVTSKSLFQISPLTVGAHCRFLHFPMSTDHFSNFEGFWLTTRQGMSPFPISSLYVDINSSPCVAIFL